MKRGPDVLLVGPVADADFRALRDAGIAAETLDNCLQAILRLEQTSTPLVILSSRANEGRDEAAVRAVRETSCHPRVLLTVPPGAMPDARERGVFELDSILPEPYFPEDLVARVEKILAEAAPVAESSAASASDALTGWLADLATLHGSVENLTHVSENIAALIHKQAHAGSVSVYVPTSPGAPLTLMATTGPRSRIRLSLTGLEGGPAAEALRTGQVATNGKALAIPLPLRDNVHGLLLLADQESGSAFRPADAEALAPLTAQASRAVMTALKIRHLTDLSTIDDLTGLHNTRSFRQSIDGEFRRAARYERPLSLAIIDVDHFKIYNDRNGHEAGNRCLKQLSDILKAGFRTTDIVCRYGGEEFAVLLPEVARGDPGNGAGAWHVLERLRARVEATPFPGERDQPSRALTISCGVAGFPEDARDPGSLLEAADRALYRAKGAGRNQVCVPEAGTPLPRSPEQP